MGKPSLLTRQVIDLLETTGLTQAEIAGRLGTTFQNVSRVAKSFGVVRPGDFDRERQEAAVEKFLTESDLPLSRIAAETGVSLRRVREIKAGLGVAFGAGSHRVVRTCIRCCEDRHPRLFDDSDVCWQCRQRAETSQLVRRLDRLAHKPRMAGPEVLKERWERVRAFYQFGQ